MTQAILVPFSKEPSFGTCVPFQEIDLADITGNSAVQTLLAPAKWIMALIHIKTYVVGTATIGPIFRMTAASVVGMTTNLTVLGMPVTGDNVASATEAQDFWIGGMIAASAGYGFCQILVTLNGTATIAYDAAICCVQ